MLSRARSTLVLAKYIKWGYLITEKMPALRLFLLHIHKCMILHIEENNAFESRH